MIKIPFRSFFKQPLKPIHMLFDDTLSKGLLGDGFFVVCEDHDLKSPIAGTIQMIYPTQHYALIESEGQVMMFHFGLGNQLHTIAWHVKVGQSFEIGDVLATLKHNFYEKDASQHVLSIIVMESTHCELKDQRLTCIKKAT